MTYKYLRFFAQFVLPFYLISLSKSLRVKIFGNPTSELTSTTSGIFVSLVEIISTSIHPIRHLSGLTFTTA